MAELDFKRLLLKEFPTCFIFVFLCIGQTFGWSNIEGGDHQGADWEISVNTEISGTHTNIGHFKIDTGINVTVKGYDGNSYGFVEIHASTITIDGVLNGVGKGYRRNSWSSPPNSGEGPGGGQALADGTLSYNTGGGGGYGGHGGIGGIVIFPRKSGHTEELVVT